MNVIKVRIVIGAIVLLLSSYVLKVCYNHAVVDGLSKDPNTGSPRLAAIDMKHAMVLYILLTIFIAPSVIVQGR